MRLVWKENDDHCVRHPWYVGFVDYDHSCRKILVAICPLNVPIRFAVLAWRWCMYPFQSSMIDRRERYVRQRIAYLDDRLMRAEEDPMTVHSVWQTDGDYQHESRI